MQVTNKGFIKSNVKNLIRIKSFIFMSMVIFQSCIEAESLKDAVAKLECKESIDGVCSSQPKAELMEV